MANKKLLWIGGGITLFIIAAVIALAVEIFPLAVYTMKGQSMQPTLAEGQRVGLNEFLTDYKRADIVVIALIADEHVIKRIIGLPGEQVRISNGIVYIDGVALVESYVTGPTSPDSEVELNNDEYFVMGDNRLHSSDSRIFGPISKEMILGTVRILK